MTLSHPATQALYPFHPDEPALVARLRQGDMDALSALYQRHSRELLGLARRLTGSLADGEDVVQDLFVGLPEAIRRYEDRGHLRAWLRRIVIRLALMRIRSGKVRRTEPLEEGSAEGRQDDERDSAVHDALAALAPDDRAIVVLKVVEGYDHREIAELLGIRRGTSEVRLHRAMARLRQLLEVE